MKYTNPQIESSYQENDIGRTLYDLVLELKPKKIIEFGALNGYSAICMAMALHKLGRGKVYSYDLWGKYAYKHGKMTEAQQNAWNYGVDNYIEFLYGDFDTWDVEDFDLLHLDISNDGDKLIKAKEKLKGKGVVIFEGGSKERDEVEWMTKYDRKPIQGSVEYEVLNPLFPSLSKLL